MVINKKKLLLHFLLTLLEKFVVSGSFLVIFYLGLSIHFQGYLYAVINKQL